MNQTMLKAALALTLGLAITSCNQAATPAQETPAATTSTAPGGEVTTGILAAAQTYQTRVARAMLSGDTRGLTAEDAARVRTVQEAGKAQPGSSAQPSVNVVLTGPVVPGGDRVEVDAHVETTHAGDALPATAHAVRLTLAREGGGWAVVDSRAQAKPTDPNSLSSLSVSSPAVMVDRAQRWVNLGIAYNQGLWFEGYRQDCSGLISMAWGLRNSAGQAISAVTGTLYLYSNQVTRDQLQPGDAVNNQGIGNAGHVVLFKQWVNKAQGTFIALEENGGYGRTVQTTLTLVPYGTGWTIREYNHVAPGPYVFQRSKHAGPVVSDPAPPPPPGGVMLQRAGTNLTINTRPYPGTTYAWLWARDPNDQEQVYDLFQPGQYGGNAGVMLRRKGTSACLNAYMPSNGSDLYLYSCIAGDPDQQWEVVPNGATKMLRNRGRGMCLNAHYLYNGGRVNMWACNAGDPDQQFVF